MCGNVTVATVDDASPLAAHMARDACASDAFASHRCVVADGVAAGAPMCHHLCKPTLAAMYPIDFDCSIASTFSISFLFCALAAAVAPELVLVH